MVDSVKNKAVYDKGSFLIPLPTMGIEKDLAGRDFCGFR